MSGSNGYVAFLLAVLVAQTSNSQIQGQHRPSRNIYENVTTSSLSSLSSPKICRYWEGSTDYTTYKLTTCAHCYRYQFPKAELKPYLTNLVSINGTVFSPLTFLVPDIQNQSLVDKICQTLPNPSSCEQWVQCCSAAEHCCDTQNTETLQSDTDHSCPSTWDGFACWKKASRGEVLGQSCPGYIPTAMPARDAYKTCTENGTWFELTGKEWTNYTTCLNFDSYKVVIFVKIGCSMLSLLALTPSLAIFLSYRTLRNQNRIRLHIHMFSSFMVYAVIIVLWETLVVYDRVQHAGGSTVMGSNSIGCRLLYILTRYTSTANFIWMFCEGLYLHRLIVKAFQPPKRLVLFYIMGWGFPLIPTLAYTILRAFKKNDNCWVHHIGGYEWIFYVPNFLALAVNLFFLFDILRILLTQLQSHPNEPSNYRRAMKATFVLIPLFGLQLFLVIYRPNLSTSAGHIYEIIAAVIVNTQGFFVALIFCLINGEVLSSLKRTCTNFRICEGKNNHNRTNHNNYTITSDVCTRESPTTLCRSTKGQNNGQTKEYIALKQVNKCNGNIK